MLYSPFTISTVIKNEQLHYWDGKTWNDNVRQACLYPPSQVKLVIERMVPNGFKVLCEYVIQNREFNYYDGKGWVYNLVEAKFYDLEGAERTANQLALPEPTVPENL